MSTTSSPELELPARIMSKYTKPDRKGRTDAEITKPFSGKDVTDIKQLRKGGFYFAKMPWSNITYSQAINEMKRTAEKDETRKKRIKDYKEQLAEYNKKVDEVKKKYNECFYGDKIAEYEDIQSSIEAAKNLIRDETGQVIDPYKKNQIIDKTINQSNDLYRQQIEKNPDLKTLCLPIENDIHKIPRPHGYSREEDRLVQYNNLSQRPLLFIKIIEIRPDGTIICYGYNVIDGKIFNSDTYRGSGNKPEVFFIDFEEIKLYFIDEEETMFAQNRFDVAFTSRLVDAGRLTKTKTNGRGGKRRSKTNGRFRKYRSRRNVSSRTQRHKKTQRR
jgi:hypothetical protein